ncbi:MAG: methyltransferase domain-containing protein [Burkholderiales bacterium]
MTTHKCRFCDAPLTESFCDLGMSPLSNAYLQPEDLERMEPFYPLHAYVCGECFLVQLEEFESPQQIFSDYAYFSSFSDSWLKHAQSYVDQMIARFSITGSHQVIEIASNDGYLLRNFVARGIPSLGIEPAENVARVAEENGVPTWTRFFGRETARELAAAGKQADLMAANNVLAHVPDINDFVAGITIALKPSGVMTIEFPHLLRLMAGNQFDTIYHEHFSYLSLISTEKILAHHGLTIFDVEELGTHGGSLRLYVRHAENAALPVNTPVAAMRQTECEAGLDVLATYAGFHERAKETKRKLLVFLIEAKAQGKRIVAYGAPAKGNTLLNYCGIRTDFLDFTVDRSPHKQGRFLPGTHIPILAPEAIAEVRPDYVLILPWNLRDEIQQQMAHIRAWGGQFVVPIPEVCVLP